MTVEQIRDTFLILDADRNDPNDPSTVLPYYADFVGVFDQSLVTPLVDGNQYFGDIFTQIETLTIDPADPGAQGVLLMNWYWEENYQLPTIPGSPYTGDYLDEALVNLAERGFDVRVMLWANDYTLSTEKNPLNWNVPHPTDATQPDFVEPQIPDDASHATDIHWSVDRMVDNLRTAVRVRNTLGQNNSLPLEHRVILNTLGHPLGSAHVKMAVIYDANRVIGFTGGFDYGSNRNSSVDHDDSNDWHDVGVRVEGEAASELYDLFREVWNELVTKHLANPATSPKFLFDGQIVESVVLGLAAPLLPARVWPQSAVSGNVLQSVRTLPDRGSWPWMNVPEGGWMPGSPNMPVPVSSDDISFAPDGLFEIHLALKKMISNASRYIYIEDQAMQSSIILGYIKNRLLAEPNLKVILLTGAYRHVDSPYYQIYSLHRYLFEGLGSAETDRVKLFRVIPAYVHSKVVIIDDQVAYVGSAGLFNRAMSVSTEHGAVFIDGEDDGTRIRDFRVQLWAEHFQIDPAEVAQLNDIDTALGVWHPWPGTGGASFKLPQHAPSLLQTTFATRDVNGVTVPRSLVGCKHFCRDPAGNPLPALPVVENDIRVFESHPAQFVAGTTTSLTDYGLFHSSTWDLTGGAIHLVAGPNAGLTVEILGHQDYDLQIGVLAQPLNNTTQYILLQPYIKDFEIHPLPLNFSNRFEYGFTEMSFL
ncbi:MAG: phospholipase D family protein [Pseudomonadota bacterium]